MFGKLTSLGSNLALILQVCLFLLLDDCLPIFHVYANQFHLKNFVIEFIGVTLVNKLTCFRCTVL